MCVAELLSAKLWFAAATSGQERGNLAGKRSWVRGEPVNGLTRSTSILRNFTTVNNTD